MNLKKTSDASNTATELLKQASALNSKLNKEIMRRIEAKIEYCPRLNSLAARSYSRFLRRLKTATEATNQLFEQTNLQPTD